MTNKIDKALITKQKKRLDRLNLEYIKCRVGGDRHRWQRVKPDWEPTSAVKAVAHQCDRCLCVKRMEVDPKYGLIIGRPSYDYPDEYQLHRQEGDGAERLVSPNAVRAILAAIEPTEEIVTP